jgi:hypothetical protein
MKAQEPGVKALIFGVKTLSSGCCCRRISEEESHLGALRLGRTAPCSGAIDPACLQTVITMTEVHSNHVKTMLFITPAMCQRLHVTPLSPFGLRSNSPK